MTKIGRPQKPERRCLVCLHYPKQITEGLCPTCWKLIHLEGEGVELAERMIRYMVNNQIALTTKK